MPRIPRIVRTDPCQKTVYHVISRTALEGLPFKHSEKHAKGFEMDRIRCFRYRTRYFTDSGIIGSKAIVLATYEVFKNRLYGSRERVPKRVKGIDGMYSMKRLTEVREVFYNGKPWAGATYDLGNPSQTYFTCPLRTDTF